MKSIFKKSIELNQKIEKFLDIISDSLELFEKEIESYLSSDYESFRNNLNKICKLESEADKLEYDIKITLYKYMLLPDTRADVLSLIKNLDNIIDAVEEISKDFDIQKPIFPIDLNKHLIEMTKSSTESANHLILATRAFFNDIYLVSSHISKVNFYEHEVDILEDKIGSLIFNGDMVDELAKKLQLENFTRKIAKISDEAELIADKLAIFTIKREI